MGDVVNLRQARKARTRSEKEKTAAENRARFGQSKADKKTRAAHDDKARRELDGHKRDT